QGGLGLHLRSFVTTTKPQPSLSHNLKSVPLVLTADKGQGMNSLRNVPEQLETIRTALQARAILDVLAKEPTANSRLLQTWLGSIGLAASSQITTDLLDRLEKDGLVQIEQVDGFRVVRMRRLGGEVASGLESLDWIAKPEHPE
ncbi:MAG: hypothetical protein ABI193_26205, partial [Minicystis sp.]